jgi:hypothetical protein
MYVTRQDFGEINLHGIFGIPKGQIKQKFEKLFSVLPRLP